MVNITNKKGIQKIENFEYMNIIRYELKIAKVLHELKLHNH